MVWPKAPICNPHVVLIGAMNSNDLTTLNITSKWLMDNGHEFLSKLLKNPKHWDVYDMSTMPEKGDVLDHLHAEVVFVVAHHLFQIDQFPKPVEKEPPPYFYNRSNIDILPWCVAHHVPMLVHGDQPWLGAGNCDVHQVNKRLLLYLPKKMGEVQ